MKIIIAIIISFISATSLAASKDRGGGDLCEQRIGDIRDDLAKWLKDGGGKLIELPNGLTPAVYTSRMQAVLRNTKFKCLKAGDAGHPVQVDGTPKVCRFDRRKNMASITCDYATFMDQQVTSSSDQYLLIHHEFAGLAGLENPKGDISSYLISKNLSKFIEPNDDGEDHLGKGKDHFPGLIRLGGKYAVALDDAVPAVIASGGFSPHERLSSGGTSGVECDVFRSPTGEVPVCRSASADYPAFYKIWPTANAQKMLTLAKKLSIPMEGTALSAQLIYLEKEHATSEPESKVVKTIAGIQMPFSKSIRVRGTAATAIFDALKTMDVDFAYSSEFNPATRVETLDRFITTCKLVQSVNGKSSGMPAPTSFFRCVSSTLIYSKHTLSDGSSQLLATHLLAATAPKFTNQIDIHRISCLRLHADTSAKSAPVDTICIINAEEPKDY